jgi:hypothetical protein
VERASSEVVERIMLVHQIDSDTPSTLLFDPEKQFHALRVIPEVVGRIGSLESPAEYPSGTEALIAGAPLS